MEIRLENVRKRFGSFVAVDGLDLTVADGEFLVFLGPSGCGKTTSLRMIGGLETVSEGRIWIGGRDVTRAEPRERNIAMVFQSYALYPHMTVAQNIGYPLRIRGIRREARRGAVERVARTLGIDHLLDKMPGQLSGGERQRVALGRAIIRNPSAFLMDEPLSNLDALLRQQTRSELKHLQQTLGVTTVYVTHDQEEAITLGDRIVVMKAGKIQQTGTPEQIYRSPANAFVAGFIGSPPMNLIPGRVRGDGAVELPAGTLPLDDVRRSAAREGAEVLIGVRAGDLELVANGSGQLHGTLYVVEDLGESVLATVELGDRRVRVRCDHSFQGEANEPIGLAVDTRRVHLFDAESGEAL